MKKIIKRLSILLIFLVIISGALIFLFRTKLLAHFIPTVKQLGEVYINVKNDTSYIKSKLTVTNKSFLTLGVDTIKYKVALFNKTYLQSEAYIGILLNGHETDTVDFSLKIPYISLIKDLKKERKKGDSASYTINVSLQYSTFFGKSEIPINKSAKLKIPQPPELNVIEIKYSKVRRKLIKAEAKIKITNYSPVALSIKEMDYSLIILNQGNLTGNLKEEISIKPKGSTFIYIPIEIKPNHVVKTLFQVLVNNDNYDYSLVLKAKLESTDPITESFLIDLKKSGKMELKK